MVFRWLNLFGRNGNKLPYKTVVAIWVILIVLLYTFFRQNFSIETIQTNPHGILVFKIFFTYTVFKIIFIMDKAITM